MHIVNNVAGDVAGSVRQDSSKGGAAETGETGRSNMNSLD